MKVKSLHINTEATYRGGEQQALYLIQGLERHGHTAHLICQPGSGLHRQSVQEKVPTYPLRMRGEADPVAAYRIARKIREENYHLVHAHTPHAVSLVMGASFLLKNMPVRVVTRRVQFSIFRHSFLGMNRLKYIKGVDHIIAISHKVKEILIRDGIPPHMVSIVHSGVDADRYRGVSGNYIRQEFSLPFRAPILGNVGYLEENKGQAYLIQAMARVVKQYPEARLFILGEGRLRSKLEALAAQLQLDRNVIFTGFRADVGAFLNILSLLAVPSIEEGLNSSILDALALEIPVVATNAGGISEIITHAETGILVPPGNADALTSAILHVLASPIQAKSMARRGSQQVRVLFSAQSMVEKNIAVYQNLLEGNVTKGVLAV